MNRPKGYVIPGKEKQVCKLKRSLYGLKQASQQWYKKFDVFMFKHDFKRSHANHCLYTKRDVDGSPIILVLYVDDMLLAGKKEGTLDALKQHLSTAFSMEDLSPKESRAGTYGYMRNLVVRNMSWLCDKRYRDLFRRLVLDGSSNKKNVVPISSRAPIVNKHSSKISMSAISA